MGIATELIEMYAVPPIGHPCDQALHGGYGGHRQPVPHPGEGECVLPSTGQECRDSEVCWHQHQQVVVGYTFVNLDLEDTILQAWGYIPFLSRS